MIWSSNSLAEDGHVVVTQTGEPSESDPSAGPDKAGSLGMVNEHSQAAKDFHSIICCSITK